MFGVLVNTFTVILGSIIGLVCKKGIPERLSDGVMTGIGLCTIAIGVTGLASGENTLVLILSMVIGVLLAQFLAPILSTSAIAEMSCAGSLMILALGLNIIGVTKIKVINFLPALVLVPVVVMLFGAAGIG